MSRKTRTAMLMALLVCGMTGLAFAAVPLYRVFSEATGIAGTPQVALGGQAPGDTGHLISIRFDANTAPDLPWRFRPVDTHRQVAIGARNIALFEAQNLSSHPITGQARFNVSPSQAGRYFTKIQCFCFTEQRLTAGQDVQMPVVFYVDPAILNDPDTRDISEITLSYTFYPVDQAPAER
jgi:cytochrome c oxidase assembly protein subunit 11